MKCRFPLVICFIFKFEFMNLTIFKYSHFREIVKITKIIKICKKSIFKFKKILDVNLLNMFLEIIIKFEFFTKF
jgi:hypothetical protein